MTIYVTYHGEPGACFDRTYYVDRHLRFMTQHWTQYAPLPHDRTVTVTDSSTKRTPPLRSRRCPTGLRS